MSHEILKEEVMETLRRLLNTPIELIVWISLFIVVYNILVRRQGIEGRWKPRTYEITSIIASVIASIALASALIRLL